MQLFGFLALSPYLAGSGSFSRSLGFGWRVWAFAVFAGLLNAASSLALYRSFEIGVMSIVGPVSSAYPALTVALSFLSGERLAPFRVAGLAITFAGVFLAAISFSARPAADSAPDTAADPSRVTQSSPGWARGAGLAVVAATGFGVMFWWLGFHVIPQLGGALSVWVIRLTSLTALVLVAVAIPMRERPRIPRGNIWWLLAAVGLTDTAAFVANNAGMAIGHVSVVSVLSSLYGAVTVLLAWIFLRERIGKSQWLGILLIFAGIVLVSL